MTATSPFELTIAWAHPSHLAGKTFRATENDVVRVRGDRTSQPTTEERATTLAEAKRVLASERAIGALDGTRPAPGDRAALLEAALAAAAPRHTKVDAQVTFRAAAPEGGGTFDVHAATTFTIAGAVVKATVDGPWTIARDGRTSEIHLRGPVTVVSGALPVALPGTAKIDARTAPAR